VSSPAPVSPTPAASPSPAAVAFPLNITDAAGQSHTYTAALANIGCGWSGCIEMLADMGIVPHAVPGEPQASALNFPNGIPAHGISDWLNPELWAATDTEVLFVSLPEWEGLDGLRQAMDVFFLNQYPHGNSPPGVAAWIRNQRLLGQVTGKPDLADAAIARYDAFIAALGEKAPADADQREIIYLFHSDDGTYGTMPFEIPFCEALAEYGFGRCANPQAWSEFAVSAESFLAADPEWIAYGVFDPATTWKDRDDPVWQRLSAVQAGRVYDAGSGYYCCSLRTLEWALQDYAYHVWGAAAGVPDPGTLRAFDPSKSGLLASG
jgi:ABC-type Fe3+-hydroxamate transport system substrate-binding protein